MPTDVTQHATEPEIAELIRLLTPEHGLVVRRLAFERDELRAKLTAHSGEPGGIRLTREHQMSLDLIQESLEPEGPDAALVWRLDAEDRRTLYEAFLILRHVAAHSGSDALWRAWSEGGSDG